MNPTFAVEIFNVKKFKVVKGKLIGKFVREPQIENEKDLKVGDLEVASDKNIEFRRNILNIPKVVEVIDYVFDDSEVCQMYKELEKQGKFGKGKYIVVNKMSGLSWEYYNEEKIKYNKETGNYEVDIYDEDSKEESVILSFDDILGVIEREEE